MQFTPPLQPAIFLRRYQRFLVDARLPDGQEITVHCPNTGSMRGCLEPGCEIRLSSSANPRRRYPFTLELSRLHGVWIGVNTSRANALVREALAAGVISELGPMDSSQAEVTVAPGCRLDFLLRHGQTRTYVEVKNCTLAQGGVALFPDAVTARGAKHLQVLRELRHQGHGAAVLFCVQRQDTQRFAPAGHIDPFYAQALRQAAQDGVGVLAYQAEVREDGVTLRWPLPVAP